MKDLVLFVLGVIVGFLFGAVIYWAPLKQFKNEMSSLYHLIFKKFRRGDEIVVVQGVDLKPVDPNLGVLYINNTNTEMIVAYDVGVEWYFMSTGGHIRSRVLHVSLKGQAGIPPLYKIPHHWIVSAR